MYEISSDVKTNSRSKDGLYISSGKCSNLGHVPAQAWKNKKKTPWKKFFYFFSKKSHPKQISYIFLKFFF